MLGAGARPRPRPGVDLYFRGDAAFAKPELYKLLEAEGGPDAIRRRPIGSRRSASRICRCGRLGHPPRDPQVLHASFPCQAQSWSKPCGKALIPKGVSKPYKCRVPGSTWCTGAPRPTASSSTWTARRARPTVSRRAQPIMATSAARVTTRCSCSISMATWSAVSCERATSTVPRTGAWRWSR